MTRPPSRFVRWTVPFAALLIGGALPLQGQGQGTLKTEENFRSAPNGEVLARLDAGATFAVVAQNGNWLEVDLVGWVWTRSLQVTAELDFDLLVSEPEGENLRAAPGGAIYGRLSRGTRLEELQREPGWIEVRRKGYLWAPSVDVVAAAAAPAPRSAAEVPPTATPVAATSRPGGFSGVGPRGAAILTAPDGDTLALTVPNSELQITAREGSWVRVRLEGWAWMPETPLPDSTEGPAVLEPADLGRNPSAFAGRVVTWRLQFISLERAEAVRTDFFEGEPFLLARYGGDSGPFVYVAVPPDRLSTVQGLVPLNYISVTARVRTGASVLTGTPIVDLLSFERDRR